jgi:hypothetical protein
MDLDFLLTLHISVERGKNLADFSGFRKYFPGFAAFENKTLRGLKP